jgi:cell division protein FtsW
MFLALGIIINMMVYVLVNTGVVTQVLPNTGVPLPLISYGGTHIVFTLMSLGILLNISTAAHRPRWQQRLVHASVRP